MLKNLFASHPVWFLLILAATAAPAAGQPPRCAIEATDQRIEIVAGMLTRNIDLANNQIMTTSLRVDGTEILAGAAPEFKVTFRLAEPTWRPVGMKPGEAAAMTWLQAQKNPDTTLTQTEGWKAPVAVAGNQLAGAFPLRRTAITRPRAGVTRLNLRLRALPGDAPLSSVTIDLFYEVYEGYPVIRKWIEITNNGPHWLKLEKLVIDAVELAAAFRTATPLTPEERGAGSSVLALGDEQHARGILAVSELPSAARVIEKSGAMGYADHVFEWVLGPSERFESEPVFHFAYSGKVEKTISGISTPLDRAVERPFKQFLERCVGMRAVPAELPVPVWCSWTSFLTNVNDALMREQADIAARAGFTTFQIDDGWAISPGCGATEPSPEKFPDFDATCRFIAAKGLRLGLWVSCYRRKDAQDLRALPDALSLPEITRGEGRAMSFSSPWRDYFANDMVSMHDRYGAAYVKEDFTDIKLGDSAAGHESRTRKESLLRGLRGLLAANDTMARLAPGLSTQLTHEIYWGTPGVPCDIAALKHVCTFHIPPNVYYGAGNSRTRVSAKWKFDPLKLREEFILGCWDARQRFFAHRGLPLYGVEYYSAVTLNFKGSLTPQIQDRQVCSWLMGIPSVYAGDLTTLTPENIERYRQRFDTIKRLARTYDIYRHFQYSGVPEPTDTDWHWWGKLNEAGCGAVVVLRGNGGEGERAVNIPWVRPERKYRVTALFAGQKLGVYTGTRLQNGDLRLTLPRLGQEILELAPAEE